MASAIILTLALTDCAALLPYLMVAGQVAQWVATIIDQVEPAKEAFFDARRRDVRVAGRSEDPDELRIDQAVARTRMALTALNEAVLAAEDSNDADVEGAKTHLLKCYDELYALLETSGLLGEIAGLGAAPGGASPIPTPEEVGARLR